MQCDEFTRIIYCCCCCLRGRSITAGEGVVDALWGKEYDMALGRALVAFIQPDATRRGARALAACCCCRRNMSVGAPVAEAVQHRLPVATTTGCPGPPFPARTATVCGSSQSLHSVKCSHGRVRGGGVKQDGGKDVQKSGRWRQSPSRRRRRKWGPAQRAPVKRANGFSDQTAQRVKRRSQAVRRCQVGRARGRAQAPRAAAGATGAAAAGAGLRQHGAPQRQPSWRSSLVSRYCGP